MICFNCAKRGVGMHKHHRNNQMAHLHHEGNGGVSWDVIGAQGISLICGRAQGSAQGGIQSRGWLGRTIYDQYFDLICSFVVVLARDLFQLCKAWYWDAQAPS